MSDKKVHLKKESARKRKYGSGSTLKNRIVEASDENGCSNSIKKLKDEYKEVERRKMLGECLEKSFSCFKADFLK